MRLYKINTPIADWHSWRQADTASVARNFYQDGFNPLYPQGIDMSNISEIGKPNPERFRFVEFPIYGTLVYIGYLINGSVNESVARLVSILFSLGSTIFIFLIARQVFGKGVGLFSALIFAILPYNIFYSRVILPEPSLVFFCLGMFYFTNRWIWETKVYLMIFGIVFTMMAFLTKPMAVFYLLPLAYSILKKDGFGAFFKLRYWIFIILSLLPFGLWRWWMSQYPEGIPASSWLLNGNGIRLRPAFFRWIVVDRFDREILSFAGGLLLALGIFRKINNKENYLLHFLFLSCLLYLVVFATGNVQHDYYQIIIVPAICIFVGRGLWLLVSGDSYLLPRLWTIPSGIGILILMIYLTWIQIAGLYQINNPSIVTAGKRADMILPQNAVVIAPYGGDTAFLYQTNRDGFPLINSSIEEMKRNFGVTAFVSVAKDKDTKDVMSKYLILEETPEYVIVDLTQEKN